MSFRTSHEEIQYVIETFINAKEWAESQRIVEVHADILLTDYADQQLAMLIRQYIGNANATRVLEQHRNLLQRCRRKGIKDAFAGLARPQYMADDLSTIIQAINSPIRSLSEMPLRVELCQKALALVSRVQQPEIWASLQNIMSNSLAQSPKGNRAENLEQAISHYKLALEVYTRKAFPAQWAMIQNNLANTYGGRIYGERAQNLEQAISHYQRALEVRTRENFPKDWAATHHNLANVCQNRILGKRAENLEQAIDHCEQALEIYTRKDYSIKWAVTQHTLANVYSSRIHGKRAENLEQAISHYQQALEVRTREAFPEDWAATQNNLAIAYAGRIHGEHTENLELAIGHYQQALEVRTREAFPEDWAATQLNLANVCRNRIHGERAENLEQAIDHCKQALEVYARKDFPVLWTKTQHTLAKVYLSRIHGMRAENLERAIGHCQQALEVRTRENFPKDWADIQKDLADIFIDRIHGERTENLEQAISYCRKALEVRTREAFPEDWAATQNSLALVYAGRIHGERAENLEQAIGHCKLALEVYRRKDFPIQWALTQNNLANIYIDRIHGERAENLEQAISHYQQVLEVHTRISFPANWAMTTHNLAAAYTERIYGERAENLEQAISHYQQALEVRTREAFPEDWAATQNNLAIAYNNRICGDNAENLERAISCYQQSLRVYTRHDFPANHLKTQRNLGNSNFEQGNWPDALIAYKSAIAAGEDLLASAYSETGRQTEVGETAQLFANTSYCLLQSQQYGEALIMLESGKTRLLDEALALADLDVLSLPKQYRLALQSARQTIKALEAEMRLRAKIPGTEDPEGHSTIAQLREKRAELATLIESIRQDYPDFMPIGLDLPNILGLIPSEGALVAPLFTPQGSAIFVIPHGETEVALEHVIQLDDFKEDDLYALLRGSEKEPGWLWAYQTFYNTRNLKKWQEAIASLTKYLWQTLIEPIHQRLSALSIKSVLFLPSGGLQLLPLHAAWSMCEDGQKHALLDDYEITYAPSAYALDIANRRAITRRTTAQTGRTALVVGVNDYKNLSRLGNAVSEAETIARVLGSKPLLDAAATTTAAKSDAAGSAYLHLSCHGSFKWRNPMESALYLAQDEPLRLSEIISELDLSSTLLVSLSACETGISDVRQSPDEYLGLPAGFLQAGAPAIVSSLWLVDDRSTALLMERFYRNHIEHGMSGPAALREAQLWLRDATRKELGDYYKTYMRMTAQDAFEAFMEISGEPDDRPYKNPFYWAAFTYNGASV